MTCTKLGGGGCELGVGISEKDLLKRVRNFDFGEKVSIRWDQSFLWDENINNFIIKYARITQKVLKLIH